MSDSFEKGCKWFFAPGVNYSIGPTDAAGQNFKGAWDSLIRECIQNSLDAVKDPNMPVIVRFDFKNMPIRSYTNFFELKKHIESCLNTFPNTAKAQYGLMLKLFDRIIGVDNNQMPYLQVSDYNTKGMAYDENNDSCNFSAFVRGLGVHGGDQTANGRGGSFGLGKSTFFKMSPIRTMMVSTYTSEGQYVFEGVSSLTTHKFNNEKLSHIGYYDNQNGNPVTDAEFIPTHFVRKCDENGKTRSGTDIFIMGRKLEKDDMKSIKRQVLTHYWLSIYKGKLIVELAEANSIKEILQKDNIQKMMETTFPTTVDNAKNSINPRPYYDAVVNAGILPICKHVKQKLSILGDVELFLMKNKEAHNDRLTFFRLPCMMVMRKSTNRFLRINNYGVYGVFVCLNDCGDRLLKHLENPAHDEWNEKNWTNPINNNVEPQAELVMNELKKFLVTEIEAFCKTKGQNCLKMIGAGKYLYTVKDVVDNSQDDVENSINGYITGNNTNKAETGIRNSEFSDNYWYNAPDVSVGSRSGNVTDSFGRAKADSTDESNGQFHIKVQNPTKNKRNKTDRKNKGGDTIKKASPSDRPAEIVVPINFKVYACEEDGHIIHNICISTEQEVKSALIQILSKGEDGRIDEELEIVNSFGTGSFRGMELFNVFLNNGNNMLKVQFSDNMKHSLYINVKNLNII